MSDEVESPPCGSDEVPDGESTGDDGASEGVKTEDHVLSKLGGHHLESDVDGTGGDRDGFSDEFLETGIGVWDGFTGALLNNGRATVDIHSVYLLIIII